MQQYSNLIFLGFMAVAFWFLMIRPQQQRARQQRSMIDALAPGDSVLTIGGWYGIVVAVGERILLDIASGQIEVAPQAISRVLADDASSPEAVDDPDEGGTAGA